MSAAQAQGALAELQAGMEVQRQALAALKAEHDQVEARKCHEAELSTKAQVRKGTWAPRLCLLQSSAFLIIQLESTSITVLILVRDL